MDDLTEEELRQIVSGAPNDWIEALKKKHPDWILQAIQSQPASSETGEQAGPIEGYTFYDPNKTKAGEDKFQRYDVSGKLLGEQKFKEPGNIWDLTKQAAADLGPILSFTPLAPLVRAVSALSAAERGDILGALASGLPLADKIPGLDAATASTLKDIGKYASVGKAAQSGDWQQVLSAASQIPGIGANIPQELKTVSDYASKAALLQRAAKGDISAIAALAKSSGDVPTKKFGDLASGDLIEGFFAPGGEGYDSSQDAEDYIRSLMNFEEALPPDVTEFLPAQEVIRERISLEDRYPAPEGTVTDTSSSEPADQRFDITANLPGLNEDFTLEDLLPGTGSSTQRTVNVSEDKPAQVEITGKRDTTIPDYTQDLFPPIDPISIRDVGPVTKIGPDEKLEGTEIKEKDLAEDLKPVTTVTTKTDTTKTTTDKKNEIDWAKLFALLGAMQQRPQEREEQYQLANMPDYEDLMYGLSSGEMPYMRG